MKAFQRGFGMIFLLALVITPFSLLAQEDEGDAINVSGSGIVSPLFEALASASEAEAALNVNVTGTSGGISAFCQGDADVTLATRPMSVEEELVCERNQVEYSEYLIGLNVLAIIAHPELNFVQCLDRSALNRIMAPSSTGQVTDWLQLNIVTSTPIESTPLNIFAPPETARIFPILDRLIDGIGLRSDAVIEADSEAIIASVNSTPGAIGAVSLTDALEGEARILELSDDLGCFAPSSDNVEGRVYNAADRLFAYVNAASLDKPGLRDVLNFISTSESNPVVEAAGFSPLTEASLLVNQSLASGEEAGRRFSLEVVEFQIPASLFGQITVGGAAGLVGYLDSITNQFTGTNPGVQITVQMGGEPAGIRRLCNGELDIVATHGPLSEEQATNCEANNIATTSLELGREAVVVLANAADTHLTCLTREQLLSVWSIAGETPVTAWNQVSEDFPETNLVLVAPQAGLNYTDLLLRSAEGPVLPLRTDVAETNANPLYRAAAVANVEGALTYMTWQQYQSVLENNQANIALVEVDGGDGCILPSEASITDGTYPLTRNNMLVISQPALARVEVQSLLWYMLSDENYFVLEPYNLIGITFGDLPLIRERLQAQFAQAQVSQLEVGPGEGEAEVTPEADDESSPDSEVTPEATSEPGS